MAMQNIFKARVLPPTAVNAGTPVYWDLGVFKRSGIAIGQFLLQGDQDATWELRANPIGQSGNTDATTVPVVDAFEEPIEFQTFARVPLEFNGCTNNVVLDSRVKGDQITKLYLKITAAVTGTYTGIIGIGNGYGTGSDGFPQ